MTSLTNREKIDDILGWISLYGNMMEIYPCGDLKRITESFLLKKTPRELTHIYSCVVKLVARIKRRIVIERKLISNTKLAAARRKHAVAKTAKLRKRNKIVAELKRQEAENAELKRQEAENAELDRITEHILRFQSSSEPSITFSGLTEKTLKHILSLVQPRAGFHTSIRRRGGNGYTYLTVTDNNIRNLRSLPFMDIDSQQINSDTEIINEIRIQDSITIEQKPIQAQPRRGGAFFQRLNKTKIDLKRYQIYANVKDGDYSINCLIFALKTSGAFTASKIQAVTLQVTDRHIPVCGLAAIANILDATICLKQSHTRNIKKFGSGAVVLNLGLILDHYFLNEKTRYNSYAVKNYRQVNTLTSWWTLKSATRHESKPISSFDLITEMLAGKLFCEISAADCLKTQYYPEANEELLSLKYSPEECRLIGSRATNYVSKTRKTYWYADFETVTGAPELDTSNPANIPLHRFQNGIVRSSVYGETKISADEVPESAAERAAHKAYMCCVIGSFQDISAAGVQVGDRDEIIISKTFTQQPGLQLLNFLPTGSVTYFHNLGYDFAFVIQHLNVSSIIKTGSQIKMVKGVFNKKQLTFKDSYAMIASPLRDFSKMFGLNCKKEVMPYSLYTAENVKLPAVTTALALKHLKDQTMIAEFKTLATPFIAGSFFKHMEYAEFYCMQDCKVLKQGFETFCGWIQEAFELNVKDFVSLPSLANQYLQNKECFKQVYELSGTPRIFIQKCVKGGRCMVSENKKIHVVADVNDFDAVSLYPSAMARMPGFLRGKPQVIPPSCLNYEFLSAQSGYFVELSNVQVAKQLRFPLQSELIGGIRNYTNDFTQNLYVDKVGLEDFIKYQGATFDIVRGYYFDKGHNNNIVSTIKYCFEQRKQKKAERNAIETVYKLLMNASYGKLIQKPIKTDLKFKNTEAQHIKYLNHNYNYIKEYTQICPGKYVYKFQKTIHEHFNAAHLGTEILSMSKRIMNEVMCLAEDLKMDIFYQDTDSMHIIDSQIEPLSAAFRWQHGRELIGDQMGQFHSDFSVADTRGGKHKDVFSQESYFLGKKCYIDRLQVRDIAARTFMADHHHIRMKGVTQQAIQDHGDPMETYAMLAAGQTLTFDLAKNKVMFKRGRNFGYETITEFKRKLKFEGPTLEYIF